MEIRPATDSDRDLWDGYVHDHPHGLAYHRFAWKDAVERAYGFDCPYLVAVDGGRVRGVLPLVHVRPPLSRGALVSLPYCDVGGGLADDADAARALLRAAADEARRRGVHTVEIRTAVDPGPALGAAVEPSVKVRMVLELPDGSEALLKSLKSKLRSQVRKPTRDGLRARLGGPELVAEFWPIYARNMRDLGSPPHPEAWFRAVVEAYGESARVGVAYMPDGTPAAAGVILRNGPVVSIPWASSVRELNRWNPNMLLYWTFLAHAADTGARWFDFGRSTRGEGTYRFKKQWGSEERPLYWVRLVRGAVEAETDPGPPGRKRELAEALLRRLPVGVNAWVGRLARKYVAL